MSALPMMPPRVAQRIGQVGDTRPCAVYSPGHARVKVHTSRNPSRAPICMPRSSRAK